MAHFPSRSSLLERGKVGPSSRNSSGLCDGGMAQRRSRPGMCPLFRYTGCARRFAGLGARQHRNLLRLELGGDNYSIDRRCNRDWNWSGLASAFRKSTHPLGGGFSDAARSAARHSLVRAAGWSHLLSDKLAGGRGDSRHIWNHSVGQRSLSLVDLVGGRYHRRGHLRSDGSAVCPKPTSHLETAARQPRSAVVVWLCRSHRAVLAGELLGGVPFEGGIRPPRAAHRPVGRSDALATPRGHRVHRQFLQGIRLCEPRRVPGVLSAGPSEVSGNSSPELESPHR